MKVRRKEQLMFEHSVEQLFNSMWQRDAKYLYAQTNMMMELHDALLNCYTSTIKNSEKLK